MRYRDMLPFRMNPASVISWTEYDSGHPNIKVASGLYPGQKGYAMNVAGKFDFGTGRTYSLLPHVEIVSREQTFGANGPESSTVAEMMLGIPRGSSDVSMRDLTKMDMAVRRRSPVGRVYVDTFQGNGQAWPADGFIRFATFFDPPNEDGFRQAKQWLEWFAKTYYRG